MRSFEDAWKENRIGFGTTKGLAKAMYVEGQESRQTEVDDLNQQLESEREETIKGYTKISDLRLERDELQKRINDSIFILSTIDTPDEAYKLIDSLLRTLRGEQALKGGGA